jgi:hypothetical protein
MTRRPIIGLLALALLAAACSSDESSSDTTAVAAPASTAASPTDPPATASDATDATVIEPSSTDSSATDAAATNPPSTDTTATDVPSTDAPSTETARGIVEALASDDLGGRDNGSPGSLAAQSLLVEVLSHFAEPIYPDASGDDGFRQPFDRGTNLLAVIPGGDLADEYVMIGAHYDHLGSNCPSSDPDDSICNGAIDNATGVAAAIEVARAIAADGVPRRSVVIGLWDAEEDGLLGSAAYIADPAVPIANTVAYINFDMQGATLTPALANVSVVVGAETGGPGLVDAVQRAIAGSTLDISMLSLLFGQGRSDHANFVAAGVPSAFFTDATGGCYHTAQDDVDVVSFEKLDRQIMLSTSLARDLVATDTPPVLDPTVPISTYADAVAMLEIGTTGAADFGTFNAAGQAAAEKFLPQVQALVDGGPAAFDDASVGTLLNASAAFVEALTSGGCPDPTD